jgi:plasmid replication initiation protein
MRHARTKRQTSPPAASTTRAKIADEILRYTEENSEAADTSEGIAIGWLRDRYKMAEVRQALQELVDKGSLIEVDMGYGRAIYRVKKKQK